MGYKGYEGFPAEAFAKAKYRLRFPWFPFWEYNVICFIYVN